MKGIRQDHRPTGIRFPRPRRKDRSFAIGATLFLAAMLAIAILPTLLWGMEGNYAFCR